MKAVAFQARASQHYEGRVQLPFLTSLSLLDTQTLPEGFGNTTKDSGAGYGKKVTE